MKLYIFKCRTRPRMFGATQYETASNLPTSQCSEGWKFFERIDLSTRGKLRFAVDPALLRRQIQLNGWYVWDETPREVRKAEAAAAATKKASPVAAPTTQHKPAETEVPEELPAIAAETAAEVLAEAPLPIVEDVEEIEADEPASTTLVDLPAPQPRTRPVPEAPVRFSEPARPAPPAAPVIDWPESPARRRTPEFKVPAAAAVPERPAAAAFDPPGKPAHRPADDVPTRSQRTIPADLPVAVPEPFQPSRRPFSPTMDKPIAASLSKPKEMSTDPAPVKIERPVIRETPPVSPPPPPSRPTFQPAPEPVTLASVMEAPAQKDKVGPASPVSSPRVPVDSPTPGEFEERRNWTPPEPPRHYAVWFDIPVRDIDRALRFYSAILGVRLKKEQAGPGAAIALLPYHEGFVCGSLVQNMDARPSESGPLIYLNAQGRLDEALSVVERHGGKVLVSRHSIEPFGSRAIVLDCEGNRIALHSK